MIRKAWNKVKQTISRTYDAIARTITYITVLATKLITVLIHLYMLIDISTGLLDNSYTPLDVIFRGLIILLMIKINKEVS